MLRRNPVWFLLALFLIISLACSSATPTPTAPAIEGSQGEPSVTESQPTNAPLPSPTLPSVPTSTNFQTSTVIPSETFTPIAPTENETGEPTLAKNPLQVHFIDVGQGDSILILEVEGEAILIDGGESGSGALQYLQSKEVNHLDLVVATHPHSDHIGGLVDVLQAIPVDKVVTNGQMSTTTIYEKFLDAIASSGAEYEEVKRGDKLQVGNLTFDVFNPANSSGDDFNNGSIVLHLAYGNTSFLFTGDAGTDAEEEMISSGMPLKADILKVGHHGSRYSSSPAFLSQVQPKIAVYSAGAGNEYGHPHAETLAALKSVGAEIYGTDVNGTIVVITDGSGYSIQTAKQGRPQAPPTSQPTVQPTVIQPATVQPTVQPTVIQPTTVQPTVSQPSTAALGIDVVSLTSPIAAGGTARLTIKTTPGAACTITVYYKSGPSQAAGLGSQTADASGNVTWSWKVGSRTTPGTWKIVVTVQANGKSVNKQIPFEVK